MHYNEMPFDEWMTQVEQFVLEITQDELSVSDIVDYPYARDHANGHAPKNVAYRALRNSGVTL